MGDTIYTDKDYLDNQFSSLHSAISELRPLASRVAVLEDFRTEHTRGHSRTRRIALAVAGLILSAAGVLSRLSS